jgi:ParB-like chromosome segregation protein Spo0J
MTNSVHRLNVESVEPDYSSLVAHPLANMFPMIEGAALTDLIRDVRTNGIMVQITLYQGMILDGRNRYAAAKAAGLTFIPSVFKQFEGTPAEAEAFVISTNFHRRQLTNAQKQEVITKMISKNPGLGDREIARLCGVSHSTVGSARDRLANSPEVRKYSAFVKAFEKLEDDEARRFVTEKASDLRFLLKEIEAEPSS